jgi:hypothetical protein
MKRLRHFTSCIISLPLFFGLIATHYCAAEPIDEHKMAEATAVVPPQPQDFNPGIVNEGSSPAAAKEPNLPASSVTPDILTDLWRKLNPDGLWTNNDITAWAFLLGYIFAGMVLGKIVSILLLRVASGKDGVISKSLFDLAGPANLALVTLGIGLLIGVIVVKFIRTKREFGKFIIGSEVTLQNPDIRTVALFTHDHEGCTW